MGSLTASLTSSPWYPSQYCNLKLQSFSNNKINGEKPPLYNVILNTKVDLGECTIKLCHSLGPPSEDLPNWRRVPGFPVFGVGQPTEKGFAKIPEKIGKEKTIWFNCRQEPVAYVNGVSVTARSKKNPHANIESNDCLEDKLVSTIEGKLADGKVKLTKDKAEADNPMDREEEDEHPAVDL